MENKCKIIQDLLPTYIENMTSVETANFIKSHIENCNECQKIYNFMKSDFEKENLENIKIIENIKKYRNKIKFIKTVIALIVISILLFFTINIGYKFYIVRKTLVRNTNYKAFESFTIEEYDDNVEHYEKHYTTYYKNNIMKKYYGNDVVEYFDGKTHYCFDNENKTYWISKVPVNTSLNIDINIIYGMENITTKNGINNFEILKFILFNEDLQVGEHTLREKKYHLISSYKGGQLFIDKDTFYVERIIYPKKPSYEAKEYRVRTGNVGWREIQEPDFTKYTLIEK